MSKNRVYLLIYISLKVFYMIQNYSLDCEFFDDGVNVDLISIGLVNIDTQETLYMVSNQFNYVKALKDPWIRDNVLNLIDMNDTQYSLVEIREAIIRFIPETIQANIWAYNGTFDWYLFIRLFGKMEHLPKHFPNSFSELKQLIKTDPNFEKQEHEGRKHHALDDAIHQANIYKKFMSSDRSNYDPIFFHEKKDSETYLTGQLQILENKSMNKYKYSRDL